MSTVFDRDSSRRLFVQSVSRSFVPLLAGVLYTVTASRVLLGGDSAELAAVGATGGVAHPPGYPLYILWLRATSWLPATSPAHRAALATAILGALSVAALQQACVAWGARQRTAAVAAAIYAVSPLAWRLATEPEVFALNVLLAMGIVIFAAPGPPPRGSETLRVAVLALLAGLGISNHHTIVLLAPLGLWASVRALRHARAPGLAALAGISTLAIGLSAYAYLVVASRAAPLDAGCVWGDTGTASGLLHHFLRKDYGTTQLAVSTAAPDPVRHWVVLGHSLLGSCGLPLFGLAVFRVRRERVATLMLVACFVLTGPALVSLFNLPSHGVGRLVVSRFHLLPLALGVHLGAVGLDRALAFVPRRAGAALLAVIAPLLGVRAACSWADVRADHRPTTELYVRNVLTTLPENAIVLASSDDVIGGFLYARCALGLRPDVDVISPHLLLSDWYPRRLSAKLGYEVVRGVRRPGAEHPTLSGPALLTQTLATGRPVFLTAWFVPQLATSFPSYPVGPLIRVVDRPEAVLAPGPLLALNERVFERLDLEGVPAPPGTWAGARAADYARPWLVLAQAFERGGDPTAAAWCRERARTLTPR
ncbi:MAG: DUF2723 domain-containing protein [Labilithrix sp.]|nr:DUF2723 domain-containing protein [Labilithrix sp.]